jgi:hypothetical protein
VALSNYTEHLARTGDQVPAPDPVREAPPQPMAAYAPPPLTVGRRPALELSLPMSGVRPVVTASPADGGIEMMSPLDVPAFLRRQN